MSPTCSAFATSVLEPGTTRCRIVCLAEWLLPFFEPGEGWYSGRQRGHSGRQNDEQVHDGLLGSRKFGRSRYCAWFELVPELVSMYSTLAEYLYYLHQKVFDQY